MKITDIFFKGDKKSLITEIKHIPYRIPARYSDGTTDYIVTDINGYRMQGQDMGAFKSTSEFDGTYGLWVYSNEEHKSFKSFMNEHNIPYEEKYLTGWCYLVDKIYFDLLGLIYEIKQIPYRIQGTMLSKDSPYTDNIIVYFADIDIKGEYKKDTEKCVFITWNITRYDKITDFLDEKHIPYDEPMVGTISIDVIYFDLKSSKYQDLTEIKQVGPKLEIKKVLFRDAIYPIYFTRLPFYGSKNHIFSLDFLDEEANVFAFKFALDKPAEQFVKYLKSQNIPIEAYYDAYHDVWVKEIFCNVEELSQGEYERWKEEDDYDPNPSRSQGLDFHESLKWLGFPLNEIKQIKHLIPMWRENSDNDCNIIAVFDGMRVPGYSDDYIGSDDYCFPAWGAVYDRILSFLHEKDIPYTSPPHEGLYLGYTIDINKIFFKKSELK